MESNGKIITVFILFLIYIFTLPVYSQDADEAEWILYRKGINFYNSKDFSEAFKYFREAAVKRDFPEAEFYIGRIFENEGEFPLALKQYERAEAFSSYLFTDSFINIIKIHKAEVLKKLDNHNKYQEIMINLIKKSAADKKTSPYLRVLPEKLLKNGLDKLMLYYRLDGDELIYPAGELGVYYFTLSQDNNSIKYLTPAVSASLSKAFLILQNYDPQYSYTNIEDFIKDTENNKNSRKYLESVHFYKYLFYLSLTLHNAGKTDESYRIFEILCRSMSSGKYRDISGRILKNRESPRYIENVKKSLLLTVE